MVADEALAGAIGRLPLHIAVGGLEGIRFPEDGEYTRKAFDQLQYKKQAGLHLPRFTTCEYSQTHTSEGDASRSVGCHSQLVKGMPVGVYATALGKCL